MIFQKGIRSADKVFWKRRWKMLGASLIFVFGVFFMAPEIVSNIQISESAFIEKTIISSILSLALTAVLITLVCLAHAITNNQAKWVFALIALFPLAILPYLITHRAPQTERQNI